MQAAAAAADRVHASAGAVAADLSFHAGGLGQGSLLA